MKKIINYLPFFVLFFLPLLFYPGVETSGWRSSSDVHALLEFASSLLAITAGVMVLLHFFTTGRWFFLIISIGFVLIGAEEFVHAIFSFNRIWPEKPPTVELAISTTWLTGHFILLTSFFIALLFGKKEIIPAKRVLNAVVYNIIGLLFAASVALLIFNIPFLPDFVQLGSITKKLIELSLALLYFVTFLFYSNIYVKQQSHSPLLWSIIACITFRALAHIFVFDAQGFYDSHWDTAHLIVFLSYFFPIFGVWGETIKLHRSAQVQVIELGKEINERKRAEEALKKSEALYREAQVAAHIGHWELDTSIMTPTWSEEIFHIFGLDPEKREPSFSLHEKITHPDNWDILNKAVTTSIAEGTPFNIEFRIVRPDNTIRWMHATGHPRKDSQGRIERLFGTAQDITDRKQAEEALCRSEENFRHSLDDSPMGVRIVTVEGETIYANRAILDIYGYDSIEEFKTISVEKRYTPESHAEFQIRREKRKRGDHVPSEYDISIVKKDDEVRHLQVVRKEILWDGERQFQVLYADFTERKRMEEELHVSLEKYRVLFETFPLGISITDAVGHIIETNRESEKLLGISRDEHTRREYVGPEWHIIRTDGTSMPIDEYASVRAMKESRLVKNVEMGIVKSNQEITWINVTAAPIPLENFGVAITYGDITERKRAEEELRTSRLQLRALAKRLEQIREEERIMIAREIHDEMGGGLTGLKMDLSWLLRKMGDADPGEERVALMDKIHTSNALIDQLIRVVRRISTDLRPSILDDLGLIAALEWQLSEFTSRTEIPHEFATTLEYVDMKEDTAVAVFRIFQEALTNVVRHARATKVVVVLREGERSPFGDETLVLEIRDNGRGITEEEILNSESLGLLGMKERVLTFGGNLTILGEPGGGTTLVLEIPRKQGEPS